MSYFRPKRRTTNNNVFLQNRLTTFTNPPLRTGNLYVEKNETVFGDLDICGNLTVGNNIKANSFYATGNFYLDNYILIPAGTIIQSASVNEPNGWFNCDGRLLNKIAYSDLFAAISYTFGGSDFSFNIPDIRGRVPVGAGSTSGLTNRNLGDVGGEERHTLTVSEMPSHTHSLTRRSNADADAIDTDDANMESSSASTTDRTEIGLFNTYNSGEDESHNNMQPFIVLRYLIKF
jgi:microcystin-dependent protein